MQPQSKDSLQALFQSLNPPQREGVEATHGPVLVIAGAGSGKTKMLTARIVHLMAELNVPGQHILAVTFTNKAAAEMRERVTRTLGMAPDSFDPPPFFMSSANYFSQPTIGTFHSICVRILRREIERTPFTKQFVIYDDADQLALVKAAFLKVGILDKSFSPKSFQWAINQAKCSAVEPRDMEPEAFDLYAKNLKKVYEFYQTELFKNNALDFGEIITMTYRLLRDNPDLLEKYQNLYQFIHVDEYQDTNRAQYLLIRILAQKNKNIFVVGDEDQSIYSWRGADIKNILDFEKDYPNSKYIKLEQNYRSTQTIIKASSELIANNSSRKAKTLWTDNEVGNKIFRFQVSDERAESELIGARIREACEQHGYSFNDIALFYRTNAQSRVIEDVLRRSRIPYKIVGGLKFYDRKEIKDIMAYFRVLINPEDSVSFKRIINVPQRGIGKTTVDKIEEFSIANAVTFEMALRMIAQPQKAEHGAILAAAARKKILAFLSQIEDLRRIAFEKPVLEFYHELLDRTGYVQELKTEATEESLARVENLEEFNSSLTEFGFTDHPAIETLPLLLESVALIGEENKEDFGASGSVSLMTLHMSKGLEFDLVFMVGMEEGLFPSVRQGEDFNEDDDEIEEERRLCYVGMTRARKELVMTHAVCRRIYGNIIYNNPARFFDEIPAKYVEFKDLAKFQRSVSASTTSDSYDWEGGSASIARAALTSDESSPVGKRVRHSVYGEGVIRNFEGAGSSVADGKVTVEFLNRTTKKFILKFANLEYL